MKEIEIRTYPKRCVGCRLCQLICSFTYEKAYNPSKARIRIERLRAGSAIGFTEECNNCGICVDYCMYDALEKVFIEEGD